jgi:bifunctional DNA-binding transcriptional regulator/antitoxin component of YhaV-PrlF toxin-antitoxin module
MEIRRKFQIDEETRVAFIEEKGRLFLQPVTDEFIDSMKGVLAGRGLPDRVERSKNHEIGMKTQSSLPEHERGNGADHK